MKNSKLKSAAAIMLSAASLVGIGCTNNSKLFFTIDGKDLEVVFCDRGASIYSIKYKNDYITYHPKNQSDFLRDDYYYGKCLGRVAGRIKDGKINVDGKEYTLDINETGGLKNNNIHGGKNALSTKNFTRTIKEYTDYTMVTFTYLSPALESGFPEELYCVYSYKVYKTASKIDINISAVSSGTTPVNLSNHPYFRLGNTGNILDHTLQLNNVSKLAQFYMEGTKTDQVVIGELDISDSQWKPFDFRTAKKIGQDIEAAKQIDETSGGYDHIWKWDGNNTCDVTLSNGDTSLHVTSDADAVIMYANCYPHTGLSINPGAEDVVNGGITIEPIKFFTKDTVSNLNITPDAPFTRSISYELTSK